MAKIEFYNIDCIEFMKTKPDNYYDLAIVDPPYGIDADNKNNGKNSDRHEKTSMAKINTYKKTNWDNSIPTDEYFEQLFRVSKKQIIWGANYFGLKGGMLYWHKNVTMPTYSTGELAWISWMKKMDFIEVTWHGMLQHNMKDKEERIHPTQKPTLLYRKVLEKYAEKGMKILDTHGGSMSIAIACEKEGFDLDITEIDADYFNNGVKKYNEYKQQLSIF
jgi:site-specific DNA-methyltransferase (adenine-specific)